MFRKQLSHNLPHGLYLITSNELTHLGLYLFLVVQSVPLDALIIEYTAVMKEVLRVLKDLQLKK